MNGLDPLQAAFWAAGLLVAYSYVGYPLLLAARARLRPAPPPRRAPITPTVSLVMVAHNEEAHLEAKLRNCLEQDYPRSRLEVVVASDGSSDGTDAIAARFAGDGVRLLRLPGPRGKAAALGRAVPQCGGDVLVLCDTRQRLAADAVRELVANLADPTVGAVSGELHIAPDSNSAAAAGVGRYWEYEKLVRRAESRVDSTVGVTGALYAVRRELFPPLDPRTILDDVAVPMAVVRAGLRVVFEPRARAYDRAAERTGKEYRRKVRTLAGNFQLVHLAPWLLDPRRNRIAWQFVSHKLSRLAVPWCLLVLLGASAGLAWRGEAFFVAVVAAQAVLYALALLGLVLERLALKIRVFSIPYAFALLNVAAAAALFTFLRGRQSAAWKGTAS
jgi:cellulose synthase/poly-beta-1,6-N-acetylglucosamine synthase-like glycosyltransferase